MAASPVLADSSFYIQLLRESRDPLRALAIAAATRDVVVCGVVRAEVGRGIRDPRVLERFQAAWDVMINVPTDNRLWEDVAVTAWGLDRLGQFIALPDLIIACCARRAGAVVLTYDADFQRVPGIRTTTDVDV